MATRKDKQEEIKKLALALNDELDAASFEAGLLTPEQCRPFSKQPAEVQEVITKAAEKLYGRLVFDKVTGDIRVTPSISSKPGQRPKIVVPRKSKRKHDGGS